jgi:hypoxanthine phosphoribosyltransferase
MPPKKGQPGEIPLGMGVADGFAMRRMGAPVAARRGASREGGVREITWAMFGDLARELAIRVSKKFEPDLVVGIAKGGVFVGGAVAAALKVEFLPVRLEKRSRDRAGTTRPRALDKLPNLTGKRVLIVDDVAASGTTLAHARSLAKKAGAREIQAAVLTVRSDGAKPEWYALETDELVVYPWDYELDDAGRGGGGDPADSGV